MSTEGATLGDVVGAVLGATGDIPPVNPPGPAADAQTCINANSRLAEQFKEQPNIKALLCALTTPLQDVQDACTQLLTERSLDTAVGVQLDALGVIVGLARGGLSDDTYRLYLKAEIAVNRSNGITENLINIGRLIIGLGGNILVRTQGDASLIYEIHNLPVTDAQAAALESMIGRAVAAGVRVQVASSSLPLSSIFRFDVGPGLDIGALARGTDNS